jgi:NADH-quinone oxidoreductase subunit A
MGEEYINIFLILLVGIILATAIFYVSSFTALKQFYSEKVSSYECGFDPFEDTRLKFDVRFYLVGILFIIFDLEIVFIFPWALVLGEIKEFGFITMLVFLIILTIGFIYEWSKGALDWD